MTTTNNSSNPDGLYNPLPVPDWADQSEFNPFALIIPEDQLQLGVDMCNVVEGRVDISTFDPEYQQKIKDFYRFAARRQNSKSKSIAQMTGDTLDII